MDKLNLKDIDIDDEEDYVQLQTLKNLKEIEVDEENMFIEDFIREKIS